MESRVLKPVLAVYVGLFLLFLYGPFIVLGILSFQQGPEGGPQFPITQWSIFWYRDIFGLTPPSRVAPLPIGVSLFRSLVLAGMTMITSTVLGVMAAQAFRAAGYEAYSMRGGLSRWAQEGRPLRPQDGYVAEH